MTLISQNAETITDHFGGVQRQACVSFTNLLVIYEQTFCLCMYDVALWKYYSVTAFNNLGLLITSALRSYLAMQEVTVCQAYF